MTGNGLPMKQYVCAPIYLEPIIGSGERITVAVVAFADDGRTIMPTVSREQFVLLYGEQSGGELYAAVDEVLRDFAEHLRTNVHLDFAWKAPIDGVFVGKPQRYAGASLGAVVEQAVRACASFSMTANNRTILI